MVLNNDLFYLLRGCFYILTYNIIMSIIYNKYRFNFETINILFY